MASSGCRPFAIKVLRFNVGGPDGLIDGVPHGGVPLLNEAQRRALAEIVESGPIPVSHGVVHWRKVHVVDDTKCLRLWTIETSAATRSRSPT